MKGLLASSIGLKRFGLPYGHLWGGVGQGSANTFQSDPKSICPEFTRPKNLVSAIFVEHYFKYIANTFKAAIHCKQFFYIL